MTDPRIHSSNEKNGRLANYFWNHCHQYPDNAHRPLVLNSVLWLSSNDDFETTTVPDLKELRKTIKEIQGHVFICQRGIDGFTTNIPALKKFPPW